MVYTRNNLPDSVQFLTNYEIYSAKDIVTVRCKGFRDSLYTLLPGCVFGLSPERIALALNKGLAKPI